MHYDSIKESFKKPGWLATRPLRTIRRCSYTHCTFANFPLSHWNKIQQPIPNPYKATNRGGNGEIL